jgi:ribosomal protein RSM22 (predicted rRNA methylase)
VIAVPAEIEEALWEAARKQLPPDALGPALTAAVTDRSRRYTSERELLGKPLAAAAAARDLAARALFFTVADVPKVIAALVELGDRVPLAGDTPLRVLDLGAGAGAMSLGAIAHAANRGARPLANHANDRDAGALAILGEAVPAAARALGVAVTVATRREDVGAANLPTADLILAGSVLNELDEAASLRIVERALAALAPDGALVIIEPALRTTSRALHRVRDAILARGAAHVFAPCTRAGPCPMLADERDWCHEERIMTLPSRAARLAHVTGLRDGAAKYSYLILRHEPGHVGGGPDTFRVVGHPHRSKGKLEAPVCGEPGLIPLRLLARHKGPGIRAFERARRGDVLRITPPAAEGRTDLDGDSVVETVQAAAASDPA